MTAVMNCGVHMKRQIFRLNNQVVNLWLTVLEKPRGLQESAAPRIFRRLTHEGGKVVSAKHRPPLPAGKIPDTNLCRFSQFSVRV